MPSEGLSRLEESEDARELLPDAVWEEVKDLLPARSPNPKGGRPMKGNRGALCGILFVLKHRIAWEYLPAEMFNSSGVTCWRRLREWARLGVWDEVQRRLEARLGGQSEIDWARAAADAASARSSPAPDR